ncbi:MAG: bifunctional riboflavin kinase/FAD synthetase [Actinobacteria bacterium]|nr:bifunctional riboflavin kinase/FAD synthetase [Actinomycetota bacterium]
MRIAEGFKKDPYYSLPSVAAIGFFDGVHRGHKAVIKKAIKVAMRKRSQPIVITFDRHPLETIKPGSHPPILTSISLKAQLIESLNVDLLVIIRFTKKFSQLSPAEFLNKICSSINIKAIVVGENFHFGKDGVGDVEFLKKYGEEHNLEVEAVPLIKTKGDVISSTRVRSFLKDGRIDEVQDILGYFPLVYGYVVEGDKRGRVIGYRTANIETDERTIVPGEGVYAGYILFNDEKKKCVISIGKASTFSREESLVEAHIFDFNDDIYGELVELEFVEKIRDQSKFEDEKALADQIEQDIEEAKSILEKLENDLLV